MYHRFSLKPNIDKDEEISDDDDDKKKEEMANKIINPSIKAIEEPQEAEIVEEKPIIKKLETKEEKWKRLFTKRTIGQVFDNELSEYYKRKSDLMSMKFYIERE